MSDFVDPLTLAATAGSDDEDEFDTPQQSVKEDAQTVETDKKDESEPLEDEEKAEEEQKEDVDLNDVIDLVKDGSLTLLKKKEKERMTAGDSYVMDDQQDLFITVEKPEKQVLTVETYVCYLVSTKTTRSSFDNPEYQVRRRYQDFVWLRSKLEEDYPTHLIPPLPAKFVVKGMVDRFSPEFVGTRCRALDSHMKRLSEHPVISFSEHLKTFLTLEDFAEYRKRSKPGLLSRVGGTVKSAASVGSSMRAKSRDPMFAEMSDHVAAYREHMAVTDRVAERLLGEEKDLVADLNEYGPTFSEWASTENQVLGPIMTSLTKCIDTCAAAAAKNAESHELYFIPPLKEYILYCDGIEQVFKRRDVMQNQKEKCAEDMKKKKEEKENLPATDQSYSFGAILGSNPEEVKQQKGEKLDNQIKELTTRYEELSDAVERANADLQSDMERWKYNKKQDMKLIFSQLADSHMKCQTQCLAAWESLIPLMQGKVDFGDLGDVTEPREDTKDPPENED